MTETEQLEIAKNKATELNIQFHPSIGLSKLQEKIDEVLNKPAEKAKLPPPNALNTKDASPLPKKALSKAERLIEKRNDAARKVRVRISCMNPSKKEWEGDIFSVSNSIVGTHKVYVPFNNEEGWHIPNIIYKHILERECQIFVKAKGPRGEKIKKSKIIKEFSVELMDQLTKAELQDLATRQTMANNLD